MKKILVGMSGGVDSAVAVYLLQKQGYKVTGVFLDMLVGFDGIEWKRVKNLAEQLEIEVVKKDIKKSFRKQIIDRFVSDYKSGLTPNPCVVCNPQIKFKYLLEVADELKIEKVATGHYAQIIEGIGEYKILQKAKDKIKDQSYFLYQLTQNELQQVVLPLGDLEKIKVKKIAEELSLKIPKLESQDVCFLKNFRNLEEFLQDELQGDYFREGKIIDDRGQVIGEHRGLLIYTIGQRKGLDIGGDGPFYVVGKDFEKNELLVSRDKKTEKLLQNEIIINGVNWVNEKPERNKKYKIKIRYQMKSVEAKLEKIKNEKWEVKCKEPVWAVAPGQSLVVYDGDKVVGGGIIN